MLIYVMYTENRTIYNLCVSLPLQDNKGTQQDIMADGAGRAGSISASSERTPGSSASLFGRAVQYSVRLFDKVRVASQLLQGTASSLGRLVAQNPLDSFFMCQLVAFGVPFLYVQSEVLGQILGEFLSALGY